jgi:hypothetical protein
MIGAILKIMKDLEKEYYKAIATAHNRSVTVRRLTAARLRNTPVGACAPLWCIAPPHFFAPVKMLRIFPHRAQKNVSYRRNVMRKFAQMVWGKLFK